MQVTANPARSLVAYAQSRLHPEGGAAMIEYALLLGLIAFVAIIAVTAFGDALRDKNASIAGSIVCATQGCS